MKNLFHLDNPFMQFLARVGDMILANFLFLVCSVPIVTLGASLTALHKITQDIAGDKDSGIFKPFFRAFRENFKQATIAWLLLLVFFVGMGCNLLLVASYLSGNAAVVCKGLLGFLVIFILAVAAYLFPLITRYENDLKTHLINAAILAIVKLPRTIVMVFLNILPLLIMYFSMQTFFSTFVFWLVIGFGFTSYITSTLLMPVFREMEKPGGPNMKILN